MNKNDDKYEHLLELPHHQSKKRKQMSMTERAAQFGAFRALTGYEAAISETARLTDNKIELDEYQKAQIDYKLRFLDEHLDALVEISVTYFVLDEKKQGGEYVTYRGTLCKINYYEKKLIFTDGKEICVEDIISVEGDIFNRMEI